MECSKAWTEKCFPSHAVLSYLLVVVVAQSQNTHGEGLAFVLRVFSTGERYCLLYKTM